MAIEFPSLSLWGIKKFMAIQFSSLDVEGFRIKRSFDCPCYLIDSSWRLGSHPIFPPSWSREVRIWFPRFNMFRESRGHLILLPFYELVFGKNFKQAFMMENSEGCWSFWAGQVVLPCLYVRSECCKDGNYIFERWRSNRSLVLEKWRGMDLCLSWKMQTSRFDYCTWFQRT